MKLDAGPSDQMQVKMKVKKKSANGTKMKKKISASGSGSKLAQIFNNMKSTNAMGM